MVGGTVVVREPEADGRWPVLVPGEGVEVLVNGQLITGPTAVSADQDVLVRPADQEPLEPRNYAVVVSDDRSEVRVVLGRGTAEIWEVPDHARAQVLTLAAQRKTVPLPAPAWNEVLARLDALNLAVPVDQEHLRQALDSPEPADVVVARGQPPVQPVAGRITPHISPETTSVLPGTLLAVRTEPLPGCSGGDVYGRIIRPDDAQSTELLAGQGTSIIRGGTHCVATIQGRPDFGTDALGNVTVRVFPCLVIAGDVGLHNAPPNYAGDVVVMGWVRETVLLTATGKIDVTGGVDAAEIQAGGGVMIEGGCIRSVLRQGRPAALFRRVMPLLSEACELLEALHEAQAQLTGHPRLHGAAADPAVSVLRQLVATPRFARLHPIREELGQVISLLPLSFRGGLPAVHELLQRLFNREATSGPAAPEPILAAARHVIGAEWKAISALPRSTGTVRIHYALHSEIHAEGDVSLFGPGAEHTLVTAGGSVEVTGNLRGGLIEAGGNVALNQVGSRAGLRTVVTVPTGRSITARFVYPNTIFETGTRVQHFTEGERYVTNGGNPQGSDKRSRKRDRLFGR